MTTTYRMRLPIGLERSFGIFGKRLLGQVHEVGLAAVNYEQTVLRHLRRMDEDDLDVTDLERSNSPEAATLLAAMAALGISLNTLLDETRLRAVLRRVALGNDRFIKSQLTSALGTAVNVDVTLQIDQWVDAQALRIRNLVDAWYAEVALAIDVPTGGFEEITLALAQKKSSSERRAFTAAAAGLLLLNASLTAANAIGAGSDGYIWRTALDEKVRDHHADLEGTVQRFSAPPAGGGTGEGDVGNPGDGINCRCVPEIIIA